MSTEIAEIEAYCSCPCMDCIEGRHCGEDYFFDGLDGQPVRAQCEHPGPEDEREDDPFFDEDDEFYDED